MVLNSLYRDWNYQVSLLDFVSKIYTVKYVSYLDRVEDDAFLVFSVGELNHVFGILYHFKASLSYYACDLYFIFFQNDGV